MTGGKTLGRVLISACLALTATPQRSRATTYYVDSSQPGASDQNPGTSESLPWATIAKAARTMVSGDSTYVHGGAYLVRRERGAPTTGAERYLPALNPEHSGTPGAPIVFRVVPGQTATIAYDPAEIKAGPLIGSYRSDYIVWDGFTVIESDRNNQQDTGPVVIFGEPGDPADHVTIRNCEIRGVPATVTPPSENHNSIRIEQATNALVENNRIHGLRGEFHNHAAIMLYYDTDVLIQHNEIYDCYTGVYVKGGNNTGVTVRYNSIHGTNLGIRTSYTLHSVICQNIICDGTSFGGSFGVEPTKGIEIAESTTDVDFFNNTLVNLDRGVSVPLDQGQSDIDLKSNIFSSVSYPLYDETGTTRRFASGYNEYDSFTGFVVGNSTQGGTQWLTTLDLHSIVEDPQFVNAAARDYHLRDSSPGRSAGIDWGDLNADGSTTDRINAGAYVSDLDVIGLTEPGLRCDTPPTVPAQLRAVEESGSVDVSWEPSSDPLATAVRIYRGTGARGALTRVVSRSVSDSRWRDTSVHPGTTYQYAVAWANPCGDGSRTPPIQIRTSGIAARRGSAQDPDPASIHAVPNPSTGDVRLVFQIPGSGPLPVQIRLFDLSGHWVSDVFDGYLPSGESSYSWGRLSRSGARVAAGYYEAIGTIGTQRVRERILLLP